MGLSVFLFGFIDYLKDPATIIIASILFRFMQGKFTHPNHVDTMFSKRYSVGHPEHSNLLICIIDLAGTC